MDSSDFFLSTYERVHIILKILATLFSGVNKYSDYFKLFFKRVYF